jgi:Ca-activated chloride channel family protein
VVEEIKFVWKGMRLIFGILFFALSLASFAQKEKGILREGNAAYKAGKFADAERSYSDALKERNTYYKGNYNLGDAYYKQGKYTDAIGQYDTYIKNNSNKDTLSKAFHNLGNAYLKTNSYEEAIKAYKNALKFNPKDEDTRYNLAYTLKKMQEQKKNEDKKKDDKKDEDKQKKDQKGNDKKDKKKQEQPQQAQMSKEEAQRMLDALKSTERKLQVQRKQKGDKEAEKKNIDKDW